MIASGESVCKVDAGPRSANPEGQLQGDDRTAWERSLLRSKVGRGPKLVLQALLHYTWGKPFCWPSNKSLADETEYSVREVQRHIRELERQGVIVVEVDRSLSTQRRITFPSHPHAHCKYGCRGDIGVTPAPNAGVTKTVGAGMTSGSHPKHQYEIPSEFPSPEDGGEDDSDERCVFARETVLAVARLCCYLPSETVRRLEACPDLEARVEGDWRSLALAVVAMELDRACGDADAIRHPVGYLVSRTTRIRSGEARPSDAARELLEAMLSGKHRPPLNPGPVDELERPTPSREDAIIPSRVQNWARSRFWKLCPKSGEATAESVIRIEAQRDEVVLGLDEATRERRRRWLDDAFAGIRSSMALCIEGYAEDVA